MAEEKKEHLNQTFIEKGKRLIALAIASGKSVDDLGGKDEAYVYIKNSKVYDENGKLCTTKEKFSLLGYSREGRVSRDCREELKQAINDFLSDGNSFHIPRKSFPFYPQLRAYSNYLKSKGKELTHEQIIRYDLGFREYSELYYRCVRLSELKDYRDSEGYVDSYKKDERYHQHIQDMAKSLKIPTYILISLVANEKLRECFINSDQIGYVRNQLLKYVQSNDGLIGISIDDHKLYESLRYLENAYSDGTGEKFSKLDLLRAFDIYGVEHKFQGTQEKGRDLKEDEFIKVIEKIKMFYGDTQVIMKELSEKDRKILQSKSMRLGISIGRLCQLYGINSNANMNTKRLASRKVNSIPYLSEMQARKKELLSEIKGNNNVDFTKEEEFEIVVDIARQVYEEFSERIENFAIDGSEYCEDLETD